MHFDIATKLERDFPVVAQHQPELLAQHFVAAGEEEKAIDYWLAAGRRASQISAVAEAIQHLEIGLASLRHRIPSPHRHYQELAFLEALIPLHMVYSGWAADETREAGQELELLGEAVNDSWAISKANYCMCIFECTRLDIGRARHFSERLSELAKTTSDSRIMMLAESQESLILINQGQYREALTKAEQALAIFESNTDENLSLEVGYSPQVSCLLTKAWCAMCLGKIRDSKEAAELCLSVAREDRNPYALAQA